MRWTKGALPLLLAAVLAVAAWWPSSRHASRSDPLVPSEDLAADYYLRDFSVTRSNDSGNWDYRVQAARMLHYPHTETWTLEAPTMTLFSERGAPWYGRAEHGRIWADGDEAELTGSVELWRDESADNRAVTIDTCDLYLRPGERYAETAAPVLVQQADRGQLQGIGARAYLDKESYELLSRVKGQYAPAND